MLTAAALSVVMPSVIMLSFIKLLIFMISGAKLSVIMLNAAVLRVVAPKTMRQKVGKGVRVNVLQITVK